MEKNNKRLKRFWIATDTIKSTNIQLNEQTLVWEKQTLWKNISDVSILDQVVKFHHLSIQALQFIQASESHTINFRPVPFASSHNNLEEKKCKEI